jgi:radical SAM enzyme (TIGR01210 family)
MAEFRQLSFGNEGSALDRRRFHIEALNHLLDRTREMESLEVLSIETRPEYITAENLANVRSRVHANTIDVTIGFETQDDHIRQVVLNKKISRATMERRVAVLGESGVRLTSYVMVKPGPGMTDTDGVEEALATVSYLQGLTEKHGVDLVIYLTPLYIAEGSPLALGPDRRDYTPPSIQSVYDIVRQTSSMRIPVYSGLWSEGLADDGNDFRGRDGYDPELRSAILRLNKSGDPADLESSLSLASIE